MDQYDNVQTRLHRKNIFENVAWHVCIVNVKEEQYILYILVSVRKQSQCDPVELLHYSQSVLI